MSSRIKQLEAVQSEGRDLFAKKNADYGDAFAKYGPIGVLVRIGDKIQRMQSITKSGITLVKDEKMRDSLIDLHNYAAMAIMLIDETQAQVVCKTQAQVACKTCLKKIDIDDVSVSTEGKNYCSRACYEHI
jgi:hypothetical protein